MSACHTNVWGGVSTARPRPNGTRSGAQREQQGQGNTSGGRGKKRVDRRRNRRHGCDRGGRRRREAREKRAIQQQHLRRAKRQKGKSRDTPQPQRIYVSRRSTETGSTPTLASTLTEASATTRRGRCGGVTLRSCHRGAMTRQARESDGGSLGLSGMS